METQVTPDHQRAATLAAEGEWADAELLLREILARDPKDAVSCHNLGTVLAQQKKLTEATAQFAAAVALDSGYLLARKHLVRALLDSGKCGEALEHIRHLLAADPNDVDSLCDLAHAVHRTGSPAEAVVSYRQAARMKPESAEIQNWLGLACLAAGQLEAAEQAFGRALDLSPRFASAHINLGTAYKEQGRLREALACYDHGLRLDGRSASAHWNRALVLLQLGDMERGWDEFEWRWKREASPPKPFKEPWWDGSNLGGKTILLHFEQGLGDTIQFIRYAVLVKERGAGRVIFQCPSPLKGLLSRCAGVDELVIEGKSLPPFDVHLPLMSAPQRFRTTLKTVPSQAPYLKVETARVRHWKKVLSDDQSFRVGIAWQGNPHHQLDRFRSVPLAVFGALAGTPGMRFVNLQRGPGSEQLDEPGNRKLGVMETTNRKVSSNSAWVDTAAIMKNLDLVITVDTATAHLAGALGVPVWVALSATPDWRWMLDRRDSPWYPSMRLFRQEKLGRWEPVFERMAAEVAKLGEGRRQNNHVQVTAPAEAGDTQASTPSKVAVVTLVTGPEYERLGEITLPSQRDYANRLGADFVVLNKRVYSHPHYDKWQMGELFDTYERCIYIDVDAIVRPDCPDLTVVVPPECVGGENELLSVPNQAKLMKQLADELRIASPPCGFYMNTGVLVLSSAHRSLFRAPEAMPADLPWPEQSHFNLRLHTDNVPVRLLPSVFNDRHRKGNYLRDSFILHYSVMKTADRIAAAKRDLAEWDRLCRRPTPAEVSS